MTDRAAYPTRELAADAARLELAIDGVAKEGVDFEIVPVQGSADRLDAHAVWYEWRKPPDRIGRAVIAAKSSRGAGA